MKSIAQKIKEKGITQKMVAKMVGIAPETLSRIISGDQKYYSDKRVKKIHFYLDNINTDDENIFDNYQE
jgi:predicted transcriptional regulator